MYQPHTAPTLISTRPAFQSPHISAPIQPPQTNPPTTLFHNHTPRIPRPYSLHKRTTTQPPTRRRPPPTLTTHREAMPYLDVDADAPTLTHTRLDRPGIRQDQTKPGQSQDQATRQQLDRPGIRQAAHRIRLDQTRLDQVRPDRTRPDQVSDRTESGHDVFTGQEPGRP